MSAGNTISYDPANPAMTAPGSQPVNKSPDVIDTPELEVPAVKGPTTLTGNGGKGGSGNWKVLGIANGFQEAGE